MTKPFPSGKEMREHWNKQAVDYAKFCNDSYSWKFIEMPAIIEALSDIKRDSKIIELGCGTGRAVSLLLSQGFLPTNITGIDISDKFIDISRKNNPQVNSITLDFVDEPLPNNAYDICLSNMVIQNFSAEALAKSLKNTYQSLKVGGRLIIITTHPERLLASSANTKEDSWYIENTPWGTEEPVFKRSKDDYSKLLQASGYKNAVVGDIEIVPEGIEDNEQYRKYNQTPARILITAAKN